MPRYLVIERRALKWGYLIDAENEEAAGYLDGEIVSEAETDTWGEELLSVEEVASDEDMIAL